MGQNTTANIPGIHALRAESEDLFATSVYSVDGLKNDCRGPSEANGKSNTERIKFP